MIRTHSKTPCTCLGGLAKDLENRWRRQLRWKRRRQSTRCQTLPINSFMLSKHPWKITGMCSYSHKINTEEGWRGLDRHCSGKTQQFLVHQTQGRQIWGKHLTKGCKSRPEGSPELGFRGFCCDLCTQDVLTFTQTRAGWGSGSANKDLSLNFPEFMLLYIQMSHLISVTSDLSSFWSSSLAASKIGMTSARAASAAAFSIVIILFCSSISTAFSSASFFFSSARKL